MLSVHYPTVTRGGCSIQTCREKFSFTYTDAFIHTALSVNVSDSLSQPQVRKHQATSGSHL